MVTKRQLEILNFILTNEQFASLEDLHLLTTMSERTIRYDISNLRTALEHFDVDLRFTASQGFFVPINQRVLAQRALIDMKKGADDVQDISDVIYPEMLSLLATQRFVSLNDLAESLYLSDRALADYIANFDDYFEGKVLIRNKRGYGYYLEGNEYDLCIEMSRIIKPHLESVNSSLAWHRVLPEPLKQSLSMDRIENIEKNYKKYNSMFQLWLNSQTFNTVLSYLIIREIRIEKDLCLKHHFDNRLILKASENTLAYAKGITQYHLARTDQMKEFNIESILRILLENNIFINDKISNDPEIIEVLDEIVQFLEADSKISQFQFNYRNLKHDLLLHFQNFLSRNFVETSQEETMILDDIQIKYGEFYQIAIHCADVFNNHFATKLSEREISYIAIYLYKNVIQTEEKNRVIVVCATGRGLSTLLVTRIRHVFPQLEVVETMSFYQLESLKTKEHVDFVITTIPIENSIYPVVKISSILTNTDIRKIHEFLNDSISNDDLNRFGLTNYFKDIDLINDGSRHSDLQKYSTVISEIILSLIRFTTDIAAQYPMTYDEILGLTIHLVMAIPRWFEPEVSTDRELATLYRDIELQHKSLVSTMDVFFKNIEDVLFISISKYERFAFYQYILRRNQE